MGKCVSCRREYDLTDLVQFQTEILWRGSIPTMRQVTLCRDCYRDPDIPMDSVTLECGEPEEPELTKDQKIYIWLGKASIVAYLLISFAILWCL